MSDDHETDRLLATSNQVKKIEEITRDNLNKLANRGDNLDDLQRRADDLRSSAVEFSLTAQRVKRAVCWKNIKLWIILLFLLLVILIVLIVTLVSVVKSNKKN